MNVNFQVNPDLITENKWELFIKYHIFDVPKVSLVILMLIVKMWMRTAVQDYDLSAFIFLY